MFEGIIGNSKAKEVLQRLVASDRIPQSLLFAGKAGIGKGLFASELARYFVCMSPSAAGPCGRCAACSRASSVNFPGADERDAHKKVVFTDHPDIGFVVPFKKTIFVDAIRDLEAEANFRPFEARVRLFIINDAEKLSSVKENAANALLKTLEEPSKTTYIILVSARPLLLLPTIRSRCQTIRFAPVSKKQIIEHLVAQKKYPAEDAELVAGVARGSLGRALEMDPSRFRESRARMLEVIGAAALGSELDGLLRAAEEMNDPKKKAPGYEDCLDTLQTLIHDVWMIRFGRGGEIVNFDLKRELGDLSQTVGSEAISRWLREIEQLRVNLGFNLNRKIAIDGLFMSMAS